MMKTPSSRISRKATRSTAEIRSIKCDAPESSTEDTPDSGAIKVFGSGMLDTVESSGEVGFSPVSIRLPHNDLILNQKGRESATPDDPMKFLVKEMQSARFQMMNASNIEERVKKFLDVMINTMIDDINCVSTNALEGDKQLRTKVIVFYLILLACLLCLFWLWNSGTGNSFSVLTPT